jgi:hypothetical protein
MVERLVVGVSGIEKILKGQVPLHLLGVGEQIRH